jgi:nitrous oxidase accessory protein NosD
MAGGGHRDRGSFPGGVVIEGNYIDFAVSYVQGGIVSKKILDDPNYRPDLRNHENYIGFGIQLMRNLGKVIVRNNIVRNINSRGIIAFDNYESSEIHIENNTVISEVYGAYPYNSHISGVGIWAQSAWSTPRTGSRVTIVNNKIICDKVNYCGIVVSGPAMYRDGAGKLEECIVRENVINLRDGSVGILIRKADNTDVQDNKISGKACYGFHFWGSSEREGINLESNYNIIDDNDMSNLVIKPPDEYSDNHMDGRMFTGTEGKSVTAHVWINKHSNNNEINVNSEESVVDEGKNNVITPHD